MKNLKLNGCKSDENISNYKKYRKTEKGKKCRQAYKKRYYARTANIYPTRNFTRIEDILILEHRWTDTELSSTIHRSVQSIQTRRWRLNKLRDKGK